MAIPRVIWEGVIEDSRSFNKGKTARFVITDSGFINEIQEIDALGDIRWVQGIHDDTQRMVVLHLHNILKEI